MLPGTLAAAEAARNPSRAGYGNRVGAAESAGVSFDEPRRPFPVSALASLLALTALAVSVYALGRQRSQLAAERRVRHAEVSRLRSDLRTLRSHDSALAGRLHSAERTLKRKEVGIAPLAARVLRSVFTVETDTKLGTGFVAWTEDGASYLVTANHVIRDASDGTVTITRKGGSWSGDVAATDPRNDLAVIRVNGRPDGAAPLWQAASGDSAPSTGDELLLVGSPFGLYGTVTTGIVSRVTDRLIQTDAAANPGNSGGPALDKQGRVVGVLVAGGGENINFAVPIARACLKLRAC